MRPEVPGPARGRRGVQRRRGWGHLVVRWLAGLVLLAVVFLAGIALGRALEEAPEPGGTQTVVRTLEPLTLEPEERTGTRTPR